jgi:hypothetical protein
MRISMTLMLCIGFGLSHVNVGYGQAPPQDGTFVLICNLHGEANQGQSAYHNDASCNLPGDFPIDRSYHQTSLNTVGGGATSDISPTDVPAGIHLDVSGNTYWSIVKPIGMVILDQDGPQVRKFQVHLYCGPQGSPGAGCSVNVAVYARKRQ